MFKKFLGGVAIVAGMLVAGVVGFQLLHSPFTTATKDHSPPPVLTELRDLSDFHAAQAQFEVTLDLEKDVKYVPSAIAGERVQFLGIGTVDAVVDFSSHRHRRRADQRRQQVGRRHASQPLRDEAGARPRAEPCDEPRSWPAQPHRRDLRRQPDQRGFVVPGG